MAESRDPRPLPIYRTIDGGLLSRGSVEAVLGSIRNAGAALSSRQRRRLGRFRRSSDRRAYLAAHALAAVAVARHADCDPGEVRIGSQCPGCGGTDHGRPLVHSHPGVHLSISHTDDYVFVGVAERPLGVDAEAVARIEVFEPGTLIEEPFDWTRFEALVKLGYFDLDDLSVEAVRALRLPPPRPGQSSAWRGHEVFDWNELGWIGTAVVAPPGIALKPRSAKEL